MYKCKHQELHFIVIDHVVNLTSNLLLRNSASFKNETVYVLPPPLCHHDALYITYLPIELHVERFEGCVVLKNMSDGGPARLTNSVIADVECVQHAVVVE